MSPLNRQALQQAGIVQASADAQQYIRSLRRDLWQIRALALAPVLLALGLCLGGGALLIWGQWPIWATLLFVVAALALAAALFFSARTQAPMPPAYAVTAAQAPELFRMLGKMQAKLHTPPIAQVWLGPDFSLFIQERRRWDFFGHTQLHLFIGLPFLASASPERMLALIAQEYAHWRRGSGRGDAQLYALRRRWQEDAQSAKPEAAEEKNSAPTNKAGKTPPAPRLSYLETRRQRFVARSLALARMEELAADAAVSKLYGRDRMAEALVENAIVAHHVRHEHWRQYWQQACKLARPSMGPYAWLAGWQIKPPKARAVEERFAELLREEPDCQTAQPCVRQRVQALARPLTIPPPSPRHAGILLGKNFSTAIKQFDQEWWELNAQRWQVLHLQYQQEEETIIELEAQIDDLSVVDLERLAQLYKRHLRETDAEMAFRRVREVNAYSAHALWQQIEVLMERNDDNVLLSLAEMVDHHPDHQHRAILLALGLVEKLPQTPEVQDLRQSWIERLEIYESQDQAWKMALERSPLLAHVAPAQLGMWQLEDLRITAQRMPSIQRIWVLVKTGLVSSWRKAYILVVEQRDTDAISSEEIAAEFAWLGTAFALDVQELPTKKPTLSVAELGDPAYSGSSNQRFKPLLASTRRHTGPVPLGLF